MKLWFFVHRLFAPKFLPRSLRAMQRITLVGIAIAVGSLLLVVSSSKGFRARYQNAILDFNAHVIVMGMGEIEDADFAVEKILDTKTTAKMISVEPFIYQEVLVAGKNGIRGVIVKGQKDSRQSSVDSRQYKGSFGDRSQSPQCISSAVKTCPQNSKNNALRPTPYAQRIEVTLGSYLAKELGVKAGDEIKLFLPSKDDFIIAEVAGTFSSGLYDYDSKFLMMDIGEVRKLFDLPERYAGGIEIKLDDPMNAKSVADELFAKHPEIGRAQTWFELNRDLLTAVRLEGFVSSILIGMIVFVSSLNIITVLILFVIYRKSEIAVLSALGASDKFRRAIFEAGGMILALKGVVIGLGVALLIGLAVGKWGLIKLPADIYFIENLPVDITPFVCGMTGFACLLICFVAVFFAARKVSRINLIEGLKST